MIAVIVTVLISALTFSIGSRSGQRDIDQWLSDDEREMMRHIARPWWMVIMMVALLVSVLASPNSDHGETTSALGSTIGQAIFLGIYIGLLVALARIDLACRLLPDRLTASLVIAGLLFQWIFAGSNLINAIAGAALGYGLLWLLAKIFERLRDQEAMGRGDFFMAAGLGAWLGWQGLPMVLMLASLSALIVSLTTRLTKFLRQDPTNSSVRASSFLKQEIAFGPALAFGGLATWVLHHG